MPRVGSSCSLRQRRRRLLSTAVAVATLLTVASCGSDADGAGTPGYDSGATTLDTSTFELAGPSGRSGSTTTPDGFYDPAPLDPAPEAEETTTTTQPPFFLPTGVTSICGASRSLASLFPADTVSDAQVASTLVQLRQNLAAYEALAPATVKGDFAAVRDLVEQLNVLFEEGGRTTTYPPLVAVVQQLAQAQPPYREVISAIARIRIQEEQICGEAG